MWLSHAEVGNCAMLQKAWLQNLFDTHPAAQELHQFLIAKILISQNIIQLSDDAKYIVNMIIHVVLLLKGHDFERCVSKSIFWFWLDHLLHDISPQEEAIPLTYMPCRLIQLSDWNNATCEYLTSFNNNELREIFRLFDISSRADHDGYICICIGNTNQYGALCHYIFHLEEIFLLLMARCKKG